MGLRKWLQGRPDATLQVEEAPSGTVWVKTGALDQAVTILSGLQMALSRVGDKDDQDDWATLHASYVRACLDKLNEGSSGPDVYDMANNYGGNGEWESAIITAFHPRSWPEDFDQR